MDSAEISESLSVFAGKLNFSGPTRRSVYSKIRLFLREQQAPYDALVVMLAQAERRNAPQRRALQGVVRSMKEGASLTEAFRAWVPQAELSFIAVGEESGDLVGALETLDKMLIDRERIWSSAIKNLSGPVVQILMILGISVFMALGFAPALEPIYEKVSRPPTASVTFFAYADFIAAWWPLILIGALGGIIALVITLPRTSGPVRDALDKVWPWTMYRWMQGSMFLVQISAMLAAGLGVKEAVISVRASAGGWLQAHCDRMLLKLKKGHAPGEALNSGLMPPMMADDVADFARLAEFDTAIRAIGEEAMESTLSKFESIAKVVGIVAKVLIAGFVLWALGAIFLLIMAFKAEVGA